MRGFVQVPANDIRAALVERGFIRVYPPRVREEVFVLLLQGNAEVKVFTGIAGDASRGCGKDAIRVVGVVDGRGVYKGKRVHRTGSVQATLERMFERVEEALQVMGRKVEGASMRRKQEAVAAGADVADIAEAEAEDMAEADGDRSPSAPLPVWLKDMNPEQVEYIQHGKGPVRLLAVAGSGKTRALVHRIVRLVREDGVEPKRICAVTFSKKAAEEMNARLRRMGLRDCRVGTWHSLCQQILREDRTVWSDWEVDEKGKAKIVLKEVVGYKNLDWKGCDLGKLERFIGICKAHLVVPGYQDWEEKAQAFAEEFFHFQAKRAVQAYALFTRMVHDRGMLLFDDMLTFTYQHLSEDEHVRARWAERFDYFMQDEAQDENVAQDTIAELLCRDHRNYAVVGDLAQAIYSFRGSTPDLLDRFEQAWPGAKTIVMNRNYRSGSKVVDAANGIIRPAKVRLPADMIPERGVEGQAVCLSSLDLDEEGRRFVTEVRDYVSDGGSLGGCAAIFRTNAQSRALEEALLGARIPYVVIGGTSFYERKEVKDLLGYLRVACGSKSFDDVKRCINAPFRFLGAKFVERLQNAAECILDGSASWSQLVIDVSNETGIQSRQRQSAEEWAGLVERVGRMVRGEGTGTGKPERPGHILADVVQRTRYIEWLEKEEGEESIQSSHAANVRELVRVADRFDTVEAFLAYIQENVEAGRKQKEDGADRVVLMSIHRSKGLEWPLVFVSGCNEMILPHAKGDPEEERRLMYVAATRARDRLVLSHVRMIAMRKGVQPCEPSRFLADAGLLASASDEELLAAEQQVATIEGAQR